VAPTSSTNGPIQGPRDGRGEVISIAEQTQQLFVACAAGIESTEIEEDVGSVYQAILDAIVPHDPGLAE
jgi:hypothetical protein